MAFQSRRYRRGMVTIVQWLDFAKREIESRPATMKAQRGIDGIGRPSYGNVLHLPGRFFSVAV